MMDLIKYALDYYDQGMSVIPVHSVSQGKCSCGNAACGKPGKHPRVRWKGASKKRLSRAELKKIWGEHPDSNIGIVTGEISGLSVLDIDGEEGLKSLEEAGIPFESLPLSPTSKTGGGGLHIFYRYSDLAKTSAGVLPFVDIRSDGGMVVAPPSVHLSGDSYKWTKGKSLSEIEAVDFDFTILIPERGEEKTKPEGKAWYEELLQGVEEGGRNAACARLAGRCFSLCLIREETSLYLQAWNKKNRPPLEEEEVDGVIDSVQKREEESEQMQRSEVLEMVSNVYKVKLIGIKMMTGDPPQYILEFDRGDCKMSLSQMLSPSQFQLAVGEGIHAFIKKLSSKTNPKHEQIVKALMNSAEEIDAGKEATETGELVSLIRDYLSSQRSISEVEDGDIPLRGCFIYDDLVWLSIADLTQRGNTKWGMHTNQKAMSQKLKAFGMERREFGLEDRPMWGIDLSRVKLTKEEENEKDD